MLKLPATFLCIMLVFLLFFLDKKENAEPPKEIWLPFIWLLFADTREFSFWLSYFFGFGFYSESLSEGNPFDRVLQTIIILFGLFNLRKRQLKWSSIIANNKIIFIYFLYGLLSILWSDYQFVSLKRFVKTSGTIIMALIILSDPQPYVALGILLRRLSFVFLPFSVLFIKYYPVLGRGYHSWSGTQWFTGVAATKNALGAICLVAGVYYLWSYLFAKDTIAEYRQRIKPIIYIILSPMLLWLFYIADSATSLFCFVIAIFIFVFSKRQFIRENPRIGMRLFIVVGIVIIIIDSIFDLKNIIILSLGKRPDLTTRLPMWDDLLSMVKNPLIGFGFESFWLGDRLKTIQNIYGPLIQAHNGYLETYLNLGGIGVLLLIVWILRTLKKISVELIKEYETTILQFSLFVIICLYNWTEASFYGMHSIWFLFIFISLKMEKDENNNLDRPVTG